MFSSRSSNQRAFAFSSGSTLSTGRMGRTNGKEVATSGSSKKSGFGGSRRVGRSQSGSRLQEVQSGFGLQVSGWRLVLEGRVVRRRRLWLSRGIRRRWSGIRANGTRRRRLAGSGLCCVKVVQAAVPQVMERAQGQGRDCQGSVKSQYQGEPQRAGIEAQGQGYQKQVDSRLSKRTTRAAVNVQEAHKSRGRRSRGPQEPRSTFKRPTRATVDVQEAHKSRGQCSRGPQEPRSTFKRPTSYKRGTRARSESKQWQ
ncbi:hypothetical protein B0F90DRAFT_1926866 [Multifurca ochricompacta]|uniref:Uncharacterized protein n=1 Tax=Multifurca ochricompacta TaxID=376703 RepID=A0AAD4M0I1_9AGAM|nr:hypothetical protein B0F90DRAFT_1926866 [Multifurca ochricompacta]